MPKLKPSEREEANCVVRACICGNMERHRFTDEQLALKVGVTRKTIQNKRHRPETFTLSEIQKLAKTLKFTPAQAASIVLGRNLTLKEIKDFTIN